MVITEEPDGPTFGRAVAGKIQEECFKHLDAPVRYLCSVDVPAIPLNSTLEQTMIPNAEKAGAMMKELLEF